MPARAWSPNGPANVECLQRESKASISACIERLNSSDQAAFGFWDNLLCGRGGGVFTSRGDLRGAVFNLSTVREDEFEGLD